MSTTETALPERADNGLSAANVRNFKTAWFSNPKADILSGLVVALALIPEAISFSIIVDSMSATSRDLRRPSTGKTATSKDAPAKRSRTTRQKGKG